MVTFFRKLGFAEGVSLLLLLFVAMPLKYLMDFPIAVSVIGMVHGILFIAYVALATRVSVELQWSFWRWLFACVVSSVPFGPFIFDRKLFPKNT